MLVSAFINVVWVEADLVLTLRETKKPWLVSSLSLYHEPLLAHTVLPCFVFYCIDSNI